MHITQGRQTTHPRQRHRLTGSEERKRETDLKMDAIRAGEAAEGRNDVQDADRRKCQSLLVG